MSRSAMVGCLAVMLCGCATGEVVEKGQRPGEVTAITSAASPGSEGEAPAGATPDEAEDLAAGEDESFEVPGFGRVTDAQYMALVEEGTTPAVTSTLAELEAKSGEWDGEEVPPRLGDGEDGEAVVERLSYLRQRDGFWRGAFSVLSGDWSPRERLALEHELARRGATQDRESSAELREYLQNSAWPSAIELGEQASADAWRLVQHADHDPSFQAEVLSRLEGLVEEGHVMASHVALLSDRVAMHRGEPQRYGTQGQCGASGQWEPHTVAEPETLDERRAEVGLEPMKAYRARFEGMCGGD